MDQWLRCADRDQARRGKLVGVAIHYRAEVDNDGTIEAQEALTPLELMTRDGTSFEPDPEGLIHREEVFHDAATLLEAASGS